MGWRVVTAIESAQFGTDEINRAVTLYVRHLTLGRRVVLLKTHEGSLPGVLNKAELVAVYPDGETEWAKGQIESEYEAGRAYLPLPHDRNAGQYGEHDTTLGPDYLTGGTFR